LTRRGTRFVTAALVLLAVVVLGEQLALADDQCTPIGAYRITGYTRTCCSPWTYDGTSVWTSEKVVAASWNVPIGTLLRVNGLEPTYRVADRIGKPDMSRGGHLDILVDDAATAYALESWVGGKYADVCVVRWGPEDL
jgi:hypothetical protein